MNNEELHVVLGSGQVGSRVADLVLSRGGRVRIVRRSAAGAPRERLEWLSGDLSDPAFARSAARRASVVYDCTSPPYEKWGTDLLPLARGAQLAATAAEAKLVVLDNLYMYGEVEGPIRESSPIHPRSRKGDLRARLAEERASANARGEVRIATGRASDFFGPGVVRQTTFGQRFYSRVFAGKSAECFGNPDTPHSLGYVDDVARALVTLADHDEAFGQVWHLPVTPAESMRQTTQRLAGALGLPIRIARVPRSALRAMGLFMPLAREVAEMAYQWDAPYIVDDSRFRATFGGASTPIDEVIAATARWARATFGRDAVPSRRHDKVDAPATSA